MKRKGALARFRSREKPKAAPRQEVTPVGPLAAARLETLGFVITWSGSEQFLALGAAELRVRSFAAKLHAISAVPAAVGRLASTCNARINETLGSARQGRLADTLLLWPAYPDAFAMRAGVIAKSLQRLETEAERICALAAELEETNRRWERFCRDASGASDAAAAARISSELFSDSEFRLLSKRAASTVELDAINRRIAFAEDVLATWRAREVSLTASFEIEIESGAVQREALLHDSSPARAVRIAEAKQLITTAGLSVSENARAHLKRLRVPSDRMLDHRMRQYFEQVVAEPLRTWTRLIRSKVT